MDLAQFGWRGDSDSLRELAARGETAGRVAVEHRGAFLLYTEAGEVLAEVSGRLRHDAHLGKLPALPAVGDWVAFQPRPGEAKGTIRSVLPRSSVFARKVAGRETESQIIAANVDVVFLVSGLDGDLNPRRIERYLTLAWSSGAVPVVVLNKADVCRDVAAAVEEVTAAAPGVEVFTTSALTGLGLDCLESAFHGSRTVALLGSSGVGKSTLINRLVGRDLQRTNDVRSDGRGRHTTTRRELILRPGGGLVIDTPGMRELQLWEGGEGVPSAFAEVEDLASQCRFTDCAHETEPGCAVLAAVANGSFPADRLASYRKLLGELRHLEARQDQHARAARKRQEKMLTRAGYKWMNQKRRD
jgi:ribosome biogenesis GTPase